MLSILAFTLLLSAALSFVVVLVASSVLLSDPVLPEAKPVAWIVLCLVVGAWVIVPMSLLGWIQ